MVASAPGPAMNGNASGNTEMSARRRLSAASPEEVRVPDSRANTISSDRRNSSNPPKMRKASRLMPMRLRKDAPPSANSTRIAAATLTALSAMRRLYWLVAPVVSPVNSGISDTGSTTTKKTTKNFSGCPSIWCFAPKRCPALPAVTIIFLKASQARRNIITERTLNRKSAGTIFAGGGGDDDSSTGYRRLVPPQRWGVVRGGRFRRRRRHHRDTVLRWYGRGD